MVVDDLISSSVIDLTFTPMEQRRVCLTLQTSEDEILEGEEFFPFSVESSDSAIAEIIPSSGQINIIDNDRKFSDVWGCRTSKEWTHIGL